MHRATLLVALALLFGGCNGLAGAGDATPRATVTPAPVPTAPSSPGGTTGGPPGCAVPPPPTPDRTAAGTPATPRPLPGGTVDGETLVAIHDRVLSNYSYRLRAGADVRVWALPDATAFSYRGVVGFRYYRRIYAVGETLYELERGGDGEYRVLARPYRPDAPEIRWIVASLSGRDWLDDRIGWYEYERAGTRTWNGTRVRALRAEAVERVVLPHREVLAVNSTVYVDRRGIVRRVAHNERSRPVVEGERSAPARWRNETFAVTDVGSLEVRRPEAFCGAVDPPAG